MSNNEKLGIFNGLVYDQDRFVLFPRCYGKFLSKDTATQKATGCTLSAFWVGLGFEPKVEQSAFVHPLTKEVYGHNELTRQTDRLALAFNVVPDDEVTFTNAIMNSHDLSNNNNRSHEYKAMQLIYKLVNAADLLEKVAIPEAISTSALQKMLKKA